MYDCETEHQIAIFNPFIFNLFYRYWFVLLTLLCSYSEIIQIKWITWSYMISLFFLSIYETTSFLPQDFFLDFQSLIVIPSSLYRKICHLNSSRIRKQFFFTKIESVFSYIETYFPSRCSHYTYSFPFQSSFNNKLYKS